MIHIANVITEMKDLMYFSEIKNTNTISLVLSIEYCSYGHANLYRKHRPSVASREHLSIKAIRHCLGILLLKSIY